MKDLRIHCDRCGKTILEGRVELVPTCGKLSSRLESVDLCPDCQDQFTTWLKAGDQAEQMELAPAGA
jgi:RNA polymerase-binding transcription factor DksA